MTETKKKNYPQRKTYSIKEPNVLKWEDAPIGTFTFEEILGEGGRTQMLIALNGYKVIKD